jgi:hypothetical protein
MSIRHLVAKLDQQKIAQILARGPLTPHKCGKQPKTYPPIVRDPSDKWPTLQYWRRLQLKAARKKGRATHGKLLEALRNRGHASTDDEMESHASLRRLEKQDEFVVGAPLRLDETKGSRQR